MGGAAALLALPVDAAPAALALPSATTSVGERVQADLASRSSARGALAAPAPAVSAPTDAAPVAPPAVGVAGVTAVAKPRVTDRGKAVGTGRTVPAGVKVSAGSISSRCAGIGLVTNAAQLCTAVHARFDPSSIGGFRAGAGEHGTGHAVDIMITSSAQGDAIAAFVQANVSTFNVKYVIWRQRYWEPGEAWRPMDDRGSATANHMDHVHVTVL